MDGITGKLVAARSPKQLARAVEDVLDDPAPHRKMAGRGRALVKHMFDVERTGREVAQVYRHIVNGSPRPADFDSREFVNSLTSAEESIVPVDRIKRMRGAAV
jgi:hypothetical protein